MGEFVKVARVGDIRPGLRSTYWVEGVKVLVYNIDGCLELGACLVVCNKIGRGAIKWNYPRGGHGVHFRFG